ncbi:MAG: alkaline phosphatase family protein [Saprospiraceae bacterium]|nr:alkaline phosphatase family protein [Saprospiraceae bacterium]
MKNVALINVVGLTKRLLGDHTLFLSAWMRDKSTAYIQPMLPGVTCSVQTTFLTGKTPHDHGIVGNGWYFRDECEVKLWRQSNKLVQAPSIWETARKINPTFTCANMFWWYNMHSTVDYAVTPRPQYRANGLKIPDCYSHPAELRDLLQKELGTFPLFNFWGPKTSIKSSQWIADAAQNVFRLYQPNLLLVYLPHLDYCTQKFGPDHIKTQRDLLQIDQVLEGLVQFLEGEGVEVNIISEYGVVPVSHPIHINRILRKAGLINVRSENGLEILDAGQSKAFALADHQVAHIYINDLAKKESIFQLLQNTEGIAEVLDTEGKREANIDHPRSGELIAIAQPDSWFTYYYWLEDHKAPDFARTVDIHKKPGYDPVEMFMDPKKKLIIPRVALKLIAKKLGFRVLMDFIPLDANLIKGSHGQLNVKDKDKALFISPEKVLDNIRATEVHDLVLNQIF